MAEFPKKIHQTTQQKKIGTNMYNRIHGIVSNAIPSVVPFHKELLQGKIQAYYVSLEQN